MSDSILPPSSSLVCECCDRTVALLRQSRWHGDSQICSACFMVWYDSGFVERDKIKAEVLRAEAAGTFPFPAADTIP